jgi:multiple sugar transport system ATP-binding protein
VYDNPASVTVAQFIGSPGINLIPARVAESGQLELAGVGVDLRVAEQAGSPITVGVRPEAVHLRVGPHDAALPCRFRRRENLGSESILHFDLIAAEPVPILCKSSNDEVDVERAVGEETRLGIAPASCHVFDPSGRRIAPARVTGAAGAAISHSAARIAVGGAS